MSPVAFETMISAGERPEAARLLRSWVRIPPGAWIFVCCECRVLSGRSLCDELITRPEESYRLCCIVCDLETSRIGTPYIYIYDISSLRVKHLSHRVHNAEKSHAKYFQNIQINCWAAIPLSLPSWLTSCLFQHDKLILGDTKYHQTAFSPWHGTSWK